MKKVLLFLIFALSLTGCAVTPDYPYSSQPYAGYYGNYGYYGDYRRPNLDHDRRKPQKNDHHFQGKPSKPHDDHPKFDQNHPKPDWNNKQSNHRPNLNQGPSRPHVNPPKNRPQPRIH